MHPVNTKDSTRTADASGSARMALSEQIRRHGFAFVPAAQMKDLLAAPVGAAAWNDDWQRFASSWNDLLLDTYLPQGHRYRRRRHATLSARAGETRARI